MSGPDQLESGLFFIVGAPRSGTTLVQAIIGSHPRITIPPETDFFDRYRMPGAASHSDSVWNEWLERWLGSERWRDQQLDQSEFRRRARATDRSERAVFLVFAEMIADRTGRRRVGEKSPNHFKSVEHIAGVFPGAKFIHVIRDPRDVVASRLCAGYTEFRSTLRHAQGWRRAAQKHFELTRTMPAKRYTEVRYEDVVSDTEGVARALCRFLEEEFAPEMLRFHQREDPGFSPREEAWKGGTRSPIYADSVGGYARKLKPRQIAAVERVAAIEMERLGYKRSRIHPRWSWRIADQADRLADRWRC